MVACFTVVVEANCIRNHADSLLLPHSGIRKRGGNIKEPTSVVVYTISLWYQHKPCNQGSHSVVKTSNFFSVYRSCDICRWIQYWVPYPHCITCSILYRNTKLGVRIHMMLLLYPRNSQRFKVFSVNTQPRHTDTTTKQTHCCWQSCQHNTTTS